MNFLQKLAFVGLITTVSLPVTAEVTLNVDENIVVTAINGQEIKTGLFSEPQRKFNLQAGKHVITAKYHRLYELRGDNHDVLRSVNISLPVELVDNQNYQLVMVGQPEYYEQAKEYAKKPTLAVMQGKQILASQQADGGNHGSIFSGLGSTLGGMFGGGSKAVQSNQQAISALEGKSTNVVPAIQSPTTDNTLDQFMQLWLKATPAEREKIRQWVQQ